MLPGVVAAVRGRVPVWMDGGIRRGTDVLKVSYLQHARSYVSLAGFEWAQRLLHAMQCMLPVSRRVMQLRKPS